MSVIVDTPIWSELFRRKAPNEQAIVALRALIEAGEAILLGPIRQEVLSGVKDPKQFKKLEVALRAFPNPVIEMEDYELAASYFNLCKGKGIQGSNTDFLICAVAHRLSAEILTMDQDFQHFAKALPIKLMPLA